MTRAILCAILAAGPVSAQQSCAPRQQIVTRLSEGFGETRRNIGLGNGGGIVELFASAETGTWTITVTMPNGVTCLIASGQAFEAVEDKQGEQM